MPRKQPTDESPDNFDTNRRKRPAVKAKPRGKRSIIHVVYDRTFTQWLVRAVKVFDAAGNRLEGFEGADGIYFAAYACPTQTGAIKLARDEAGLYECVQIVIHNKEGRISRDITLPRSSDPRKTRG